MEEKKSPVYNVIAVPLEKVVANDYNPNVVAPPEMKLLELEGSVKMAQVHEEAACNPNAV